jgi:hypothetical protein
MAGTVSEEGEGASAEVMRCAIKHLTAPHMSIH